MTATMDKATVFNPTLTAPVKRGRGRPKGLTNAKIMERKLALASANRPKLTDNEILEDLTARFAMLATMTRASAHGYIRSLIVTGKPGIGKTYTIENTLTAMGISYTSVSGSMSAIGLYKLAYKHRMKGQVVVIDDADGIFKDDDAMNVMKALTDSKRKRRVSWLKDSDSLADEGIETSFTFDGTLIFSSNYDFQAIVDSGVGKFAVHMEALISRASYLDVHLHDVHSLSLWINHVALKGKMFEIEGIDEKLGREILTYLHKHKDILREYSVRTVSKICDYTKIPDNDWREMARMGLCR